MLTTSLSTKRYNIQQKMYLMVYISSYAWECVSEQVRTNGSKIIIINVIFLMELVGAFRMPIGPHTSRLAMILLYLSSLLHSLILLFFIYFEVNIILLLLRDYYWIFFSFFYTFVMMKPKLSIGWICGEICGHSISLMSLKPFLARWKSSPIQNMEEYYYSLIYSLA